MIASYIPALIWTCLVVGGIVSSVKKKKQKLEKANGIKPQVSQTTNQQAAIQKPNQIKLQKIANLKESSNMNIKGLNLSLRSNSDGNLICDDRENDWLAKEIQYEKRVLYSEASILRQEHFLNCDANIIKKEHEENCEVKPY